MFRVSCFVFQVSGLGFRVLGSRCRVWGFGFRVSDFGFRVSGFMCRGVGRHTSREKSKAAASSAASPTSCQTAQTYYTNALPLLVCPGCVEVSVAQRQLIDTFPGIRARLQIEKQSTYSNASRYSCLRFRGTHASHSVDFSVDLSLRGVSHGSSPLPCAVGAHHGQVHAA